MLTKRQNIIATILLPSDSLKISEIVEDINKKGENLSKITILRDLDVLMKLDFVERIGVGRATKYKVTLMGRLLLPVNLQEYFLLEQDIRKIRESFNFDIFNQLSEVSIFTQEEMNQFNDFKGTFIKNTEKLSSQIIAKEFERITIELSWKSSHIEGNTYTLLDTERLLNEGIRSPGKLPEEAFMLLNHKSALEFIRDDSISYSVISVTKIIKIHELLVNNLDIKYGLRNSLVRITGTNYKPLDNDAQIKDSLEMTCKLVNEETDPLTKAFLLFALIPYIQPFEDGNKRTSRLATNAILLANGSFPLAFRSIDEGEYKLATLLFYEQNNLSRLKTLFLEQLDFAAKEYFQVRG